MKKLLFLLLSVFLCISCSDDNTTTDEPTPNPGEPQIEIPATSLTPNFKSEGGESIIEFTAKSDWSVSVVNTRAESWCSVSPLSGKAGKASLTIRTAANETYDERNATITLRAGTDSKNIIVTQKQKDALLVSSSKVEMKKEGGEFTIEVKANVTFSHSIDEGIDWISAATADTRGLTTTQLKFSVSVNTSVHKREAGITVTDGTLSERITVYQEGEEPQLTATASQQTFGPEGGTLKIEINSNVDYETLLPDASWIAEDQARNQSTHTLYFTISPNETYDNRQADIVFKDKESELADTVRVMQLQKDALIFSDEVIYVDNEANYLQIKFWRNVEYKIKETSNWIKEIKTRSLQEDSIRFAIEENPQIEARQGHITIISKDETIEQTIKVIQKQIFTLNVVPENIEISAEAQEVSFNVISNKQYTIDILEGKEWISIPLGKTIWDINEPLNINVTDNSSQSMRTGKIKVSCYGMKLNKIITIQQQYKFSEEEMHIRHFLEEFYHNMLGDWWCDNCKKNWLSNKPLNEWYGIKYENGKIDIMLEHKCYDGGIVLISDIDCIRSLHINQTNTIKSIVINNCRNLEELVLGDLTYITEFKVTNNPQLSKIKLEGYPYYLTDINMSNNISLWNININFFFSPGFEFYAQDKPFTSNFSSTLNKIPQTKSDRNISLDLSNTGIKYIKTMNGHPSINCTGCTSLINAYLRTAKNIIFDGCTDLEEVNAEAADMETISLNNCISLKRLYCSYNELKYLNTNSCPNLEELDSYSNNLETLTCTNSIHLKKLFCGMNKLSSLDISTLTQLKDFSCGDNELLKELSMSEMKNIETFEATGTLITSVIPEWMCPLFWEVHISVDWRYTNYESYEYGKYTYTDLGHGWWFPEEPEIGGHIWQDHYIGRY